MSRKAKEIDFFTLLYSNSSVFCGFWTSLLLKPTSSPWSLLQPTILIQIQKKRVMVKSWQALGLPILTISAHLLSVHSLLLAVSLLDSFSSTWLRKHRGLVVTTQQLRLLSASEIVFLDVSKRSVTTLPNLPMLTWQLPVKTSAPPHGMDSCYKCLTDSNLCGLTPLQLFSSF